MANEKYEIKYLPTFISQFNNILYYMTHELKNRIAADNFYKEVMEKIKKRSEIPEIYGAFKIIGSKKVKYYKINVRNYVIFYVLRGNVMEIRRIYYNKMDFNKLI